MPAPSQLAIQTSVLQRLVKEEASYHKELEHQEVRIAKLEQGGDDENAEYTLRQERKAAEETKALFPQLKQKIQEALTKLESYMGQIKSSGEATDSTEIEKATAAIAAAKEVIA